MDDKPLLEEKQLVVWKRIWYDSQPIVNKKVNDFHVILDGVQIAHATVLTDTFIIIPDHAVCLQDFIDDHQEKKYILRTKDGEKEFCLAEYAYSAVEAKMGGGDFLLVQFASNVIASQTTSIEPKLKDGFVIRNIECRAGDSGRSYSLENSLFFLVGAPITATFDTNNGTYNKACLVNTYHVRKACGSLQSTINMIADGDARSVKLTEEHHGLFKFEAAISKFNLPDYIPLALSPAWDAGLAQGLAVIHVGNFQYQVNQYDRNVMGAYLQQMPRKQNGQTLDKFLPRSVLSAGLTECWLATSGLKDANGVNRRNYDHIGQLAQQQGLINYDNERQFPHESPLRLVEPGNILQQVCHHPFRCEMRPACVDTSDHHLCMRPYV